MIAKKDSRYATIQRRLGPMSPKKTNIPDSVNTTYINIIIRERKRIIGGGKISPNLYPLTTLDFYPQPPK